MVDTDWNTVHTRVPTGAFDSLRGGSSSSSIGSGNRYRVGPELGRGGMGVVVLAHDAWLDRPVALKRPHASTDGDPRLAHEATLTARLQHPSIATVLDVGRDEYGVYYTMPVLSGRTLTENLTDPSFTLADAIRVLTRASEAVSHAHDREVVHRDLKPDNLFIGESGEVWVLDWGVSAQVGIGSAGFVGTPGFAAPEQETDHVETAADVFSLGRVLETILNAFNGGPPELQTVAEQCMGDSRSRLTAHALRQQLLAWTDGQTVHGHAYSVRRVVGLWVQRNRRVVALGVATALALSVVAGVGIQARRTEHARAERAVAQALAIQAETLRVAGHRGRSEVLGAASLARATSPPARGLFLTDTPVPERLGLWPTPCDRPFVTHTATLLCAEWRGATEHAINGDPLASWAVGPLRVGPDGVEGVPPLRGVQRVGDALMVVDANHSTELWTDGQPAERRGRRREVTRVTPGATGVLRNTQHLIRHDEGVLQWSEALCASSSEDAHRKGELFALTCNDGQLFWGPFDALQAVPIEQGSPHLVRLDDGRLALSTWQGDLGVFDGESWDWRITGVGALRDMNWIDAHRIAVVGEHGDVRVHDVDGRGEGVGLPGRAHRVRPYNGDVVLVGDDVALWRIPDAPPTEWSYRAGGGVSYLDLSPSGTMLFAGHGTGEQTLFDVQTGRMWWVTGPGSRVAKPGTFLDDDRVFAFDGNDGFIQHVYSGERQPWDTTLSQRALGLGDVVLAYSPTVASIRRGSTIADLPFLLSDAQRVDDVIVGLDTDGVVHEFSASDPLHPESKRVFATGGLFAADDAFAVRAETGVVEVATRTGEPVWSAPLSIPPTALGLWDGWVAVGFEDGSLRLFDASGELTAVVRHAHERRIAQLIFRDGHLFTGSFDGTIRRWSLDHIDTPAAVLAARWPLTLDDALPE